MTDRLGEILVPEFDVIISSRRHCTFPAERIPADVEYRANSRTEISTFGTRVLWVE